MRSRILFLFFITICFFESASVRAQEWNAIWTFHDSPFQKANSAPQISAREAEYLSLNFAAMEQIIFANGAGTTIQLPLPSGKLVPFKLVENTLMAPELNDKFPEVLAFDIVSPLSRSIWGKFEISPKGIHAMIFQPGQITVFIDPLYANDPQHYISYTRKEFRTDKVMDCRVSSTSTKVEVNYTKSAGDFNDCQLRTYRLALAATGEYTAFQGGTAEDAFNAMVVTMNRVNGVYERDFAVTMTLVANTNELIFVDAASDPYTNGTPGQMISQNQATVDEIIGNENYDIGHVFGTNSGGLAGLGVTCFDGAKARGVTGSSAPIGDPFDIDYVAHEMGHEFGGNHSFNNACNGNRNNATAVETGSGSTIMSYAGICSPNVQPHSNDYFHGINMEEIGMQITNNNCQVNTPLLNVSPQITALPLTIYLPVSTPFALTASAFDPDGDSLTYCWEQMDTEISTQPPASDATSGPNFRSLLPTTDSTRYFPNLETLANGGLYTWERLPSVARTMNFRLSVRDNVAGGGCTQYADLGVEVVAGAGPFEVLYPSATGIIWQGFDYEIVGWDVANTTTPPINAMFVDIFLSTDGGDTYPIQLADDVANSGSFSVQVPNVSTTEARIMVMNSEGTFFDISNNDFTITSIENGFTLESDMLEFIACQEDTLSMSFTVVSVGDFQENIDFTISQLPLEADAQLSASQGTSGDIITVSVISLVNTPPAGYPLTISGIAPGGFVNEITFTLTVVASNPEATQLVSPENLAQNIPTFTTLEWIDNAGPMETYYLEVSTDLDFTVVVAEAANLEVNTYTLSNLLPETSYYWRVRNTTDCGQSQPSQVFLFTTYTCSASTPADLPIAISAASSSTIHSTIEISEPGIIGDVNVLGLEGTHANVGDLTFTLKSPQGTEVVLASALCGLNLTLSENGDITVNGSNPLGIIPSSGAAIFGPDIPAGGITDAAFLAEDGSDNPNELCDAAVNDAQLNGNIALIYRGNCTFVQKVLNAQDAGAVAAIVINNIADDGFFDMGGSSNSITIPSVMVSLEDGNNLVQLAGVSSQDFHLSFDDQAETNLIPCPPTTAQTYEPQEHLSAFNGENAQGVWTLTVTDNSDSEGGMLTAWTLNYCVTGQDVGITERSNKMALIYPNPTSGKITVELNGDVKINRILIYDLVGRRVKTEKVGGRKSVEIDMSQNPPGVYFVRLVGVDFQSGVYKIIKV